MEPNVPRSYCTVWYDVEYRRQLLVDLEYFNDRCTTCSYCVRKCVRVWNFVDVESWMRM
jgi:hypothetical protein